MKEKVRPHVARLGKRSNDDHQVWGWKCDGWWDWTRMIA
jgi:hypothetical protein